MTTAIEHKQIGNKHFKAKRYDEAIREYDAAIALQADFKEAYHNKGVCLSTLGKQDEALLAFDAAIAIDPSYLKAHLKRARILFERSEYRAALTSIHLLIESKELKGRTLESIQGMFESCMGHIGAQLEFGVVDLKLTTDGQVKILEYGPGVSVLFQHDAHAALSLVYCACDERMVINSASEGIE